MERSINLLIANENEEDANLISEKLTKENNLATIDKTSSGLKAIELVKSKNYDLVILDLVLAEVDGFEVIEEIKNLNKNTKIIVLSALSSDTFIKKAMSLGVDYYMLKPANLDVLSKRVKDLVEGEQISSAISKNTDKEIEEKITNIFITVGIPAHIKGYQFLREAVKLAVEEPEIISSITKKLYPTIAERFETSSSKVERGMRHAIEVAWNRGKIENINTIFGLKIYNRNEKPTNGELIALIADKMLMDC